MSPSLWTNGSDKTYIQQDTASGRYKDVSKGEWLTKTRAKAYRAFQARHRELNSVGEMADKLVRIVDKYLPRQAEETRIYVGRFLHHVKNLSSFDKHGAFATKEASSATDVTPTTAPRTTTTRTKGEGM